MRDILAVFNAQFHVTKGNIIEWSLKADLELSLDGVEFSVLPSGIHAVERDVVYFTIPNPSSSTHSPLHGVSIFRRLATTEEGQRGARLASLGAIVTPGAKPWRHVDRLKAVFEESLHNQEGKWDAPTAYFEEFRLVTETETPSLSFQPSTSTSSADSISSLSSSPLNHLPHLLPILGPLSSTLHKHVLARRRILIYCKPPIEGACVLAWICGALASPLENVEHDERSESLLIDVEELTSAPKGAKDKGLQVLGCITLNDMERLKEAGETGTGWVACTSDAIYLEKTDTFDLLIDLTTLKASPPPPTNPGSTTAPAPPPSNRRLRPTFHISHGGKLSQLRWGWSDIKPWTELDRIIALSPFRYEHHSHDSGAFCCNPNSTSSGSSGPGSGSQDKTKPLQGPWGDLWIWRIYEDVCLVCAGLFLGSSSSSSLSSTSRVQLSGDENPIYFSHVKTVGNGIQGGKPSKALKKGRRGSGMSVLLGNASEFAGVSSSSSAGPSSPTSIGDNAGGASTSTEDSEEREKKKRDSLRRTTTALLQSFHAQEMFLESTLKEVIALRTPSILSPSSPASSSAGSAAAPAPTKVRRRVSLPPPSTSSSSTAPATGPVITILPKDLLTMSLNPWSTFDARFVEWFAESGDFGVGGGSGSGKVKVKKGWGAVVGVFLPG